MFDEQLFTHVVLPVFVKGAPGKGDPPEFDEQEL